MVRRLPAFALLALIVSLAPQVRAEDLAGDRAFFDKHANKFVTLHPKRLTAEVLGKVFNAIIYQVNVLTSDGGIINTVVARTGDDITIISIPPSTTDMPDLVKLLRQVSA